MEEEKKHGKSEHNRVSYEGRDEREDGHAK